MDTLVHMKCMLKKTCSQFRFFLCFKTLSIFSAVLSELRAIKMQVRGPFGRLLGLWTAVIYTTTVSAGTINISLFN